MNPTFGRGRGRRPVLQLGNSNSNSSYLARYGYQSLSEEAPNNDRRARPNQENEGLSRLVGAYDDSDSDAEENAPDQSSEPPPPVPVETSQVKGQAEGQAMDTEVASFIAEINAISTEKPGLDHNDIPLPPGAFIPRDRTAEVMERYREQAEEEEQRPDPRPAKKSSSYSMFVKGGKERLGNKGGNYTNQFVKGGTEVLKQQADGTGDNAGDEEYQLPEAPSTVWQQCQDENTKYMYYWNFVTNEVTWHIPVDYTQYLLLQKEYEDKLARIPEDVRKRLEAKKLAESQAGQSQVNGNSTKPDTHEPATAKPQRQESPTSSPAQTTPAEPKVDSPRLDNSEAKPKSSLKKSRKKFGPELPDSMDITSSETVGVGKGEDSGEKQPRLSVSEVDSFVSELLGEGAAVGGKIKMEESNGRSENGVKKDQPKESDDIDFDIDDIDAALEMALERKTVVLKKNDDVDTNDSRHSKSRKHDKKDKRKDKHRSESYHKSESTHKSESRNKEKTEPSRKSDSRHKRSSNRESEGLDERKEPVESIPKKARLVAAYDEESEEEESLPTTSTTSTTTTTSTSTSTPTTSVTTSKPPETVTESVKVEVKMEEYMKEEPKVRAVPLLIQMKDEVEDAASIALGKLEFLEVTKKGLSKLQVLLLELQTRFRDWQDGGLDTEFFLCRLKEANRQLEQYEQSAVPPGYSCHWDRNFRRYFYTSEVTGDSQWEYPESSSVSTTTITASVGDQAEVSSSKEPAIPEGAPPSPKPQPPPPPPEDEDEGEDSLTVYGPHLPTATVVTDTTSQEPAENSIDGEPMPPDSSDENVTEDPPRPPEPDNSDQRADVPPVFPGEPPPPGTEVLFGLPPPPPPSEPYPGDDDATYSVDHDSPDDADMDVDEPDSPNSAEAEGTVSSSHPDYHLPSIQASSSSTSDITSVSLQSSEAVESTPVIYRPPQLNLSASTSSSTSTSSLAASSSSFHSAQPVISAHPYIPAQSLEPVSQSSHTVDMFADPRMNEEISSTSVSDIPPPPVPSTHQTEPEKIPKKEKKKKKEKSITSSSLSLKKKNVSSLVQKWQQVKVQVEEEEKVNEERQMAIRQKLEEWKREQAHS